MTPEDGNEKTKSTEIVNGRPPEAETGKSVIKNVEGANPNSWAGLFKKEAMISFPVFEQRLKQLWSPSGGMVVSDLPNNFFLVCFELDSDMEESLNGGL
ncbi:hypothetical protein V2J09_013593 [Rumex salicifolius]